MEPLKAKGVTVLGFGFWVLGFGFWVLGLVSGVLGFWVLGFGFGVRCLGFWVLLPADEDDEMGLVHVTVTGSCRLVLHRPINEPDGEQLRLQAHQHDYV